MNIYDLETFNTNRVIPYVKGNKRLSKFSAKFYRDITDRELAKCENDCILFKGSDSTNENSDHVLQLKGAAKKGNEKYFKNNLYVSAHNGCSFNTYVVLNNLLQERTVVSLIQNGSGNVSLKVFNGFVDQNKKIPQ